MSAHQKAGHNVAHNVARKFDTRLYENPRGKLVDFSFGILRRSRRGELNTAEGYVRSKLRRDAGPLDQANCVRDVTANVFVVNPECPDLLATASAFWATVDASVWKNDQDLAVATTLWFPRCRAHHLAMRTATEFAQIRLADARGLCAQVVGHAPSRIGHRGDYHVHLIISARSTNSDGLTTFARDLLGYEGQTTLHGEWDAWKGRFRARFE